MYESFEQFLERKKHKKKKKKGLKIVFDVEGEPVEIAEGLEGSIMVDTKELYQKQSLNNKKIMDHQRVEDERYLETLKKNIHRDGILNPTRFSDGKMKIEDALHRLAGALDLDIPQFPFKIQDRLKE